MNRKQIGFDVISENVGNSTEKQILLGRVQRYLDEGWEVLNTHVPQTGSGAITITVVLVKYEDVVQTTSSKDIPTPKK